MDRKGRSRVDGDLARRMVACGQPLLRTARSILADHHLAEDAVGQTFLKAWQGRGSLRDRRKLKAWLTRICRREAMTLLRKERRLQALRVSEGAPLKPDNGKELLSQDDVLEKLPVELKVCAELFFFGGHSYSEIASIAGLPLSTVRGRIHLTRKHLRREIEMTRQATAPTDRPEVEILCPRRGRAEWRGARIRFLGIAWTGSRTVYDALGKRLSRIPAALRESAFLLRPFETPVALDRGKPAALREFEDPEGVREKYKLSLFWELAGSPSVALGCRAVGATTGRLIQPYTNQIESIRGRNGKRVICFLCGTVPEGDRDIRCRSSVHGPADPTRVFRFVPGGKMEGTGWTTVSSPVWGVCFLTDRRPGLQKGTCNFTVALSSPYAEGACRILVVDNNGEEREPVATAGGAATSPAGHLRVETLDVDLPPDQVAGVAIYERHRATIDWGRIRIPRKPRVRRP